MRILLPFSAGTEGTIHVDPLEPRVANGRKNRRLRPKQHGQYSVQFWTNGHDSTSSSALSLANTMEYVDTKLLGRIMNQR